MSFSEVVLALNVIYISVVGANMCSSSDLVPMLQRNIFIRGNAFIRLPNVSVMRCAKECMLRRRCRSFNFDLNTLTCRLNSGNSPDTQTSPIEGWVSSDIAFEYEKLLGECQGHTCDLNEKCHVTDSGAAACMVIGCLTPAPIENGQILTNGKLFWNLGETVSYRCESDDVDDDADGELVCQDDGTWATVQCLED